MFKHERYQELCALSVGGQLSQEEQSQLSEHVKHCPECQAASEDFSLIWQELPAVEPDLAAETSLGSIERAGLRQRFLRAARAEGIQVGGEVERLHVRTKLFPFVPLFQWGLAGALLVVIGAVVGYQTMSKHRLLSPAAAHQPKVTVHVQNKKAQEHLEAQLSEIQEQRAASDQAAAGLKHDIESLLERLAALEKQFTALVSEKQQLETTLAHVNGANSDFVRQNEQNVRLLEQTRTELERVRSEGSQTAATLVAERQTVNDLTEELASAKTSLDRERELLAAGRDVRDIMGARELHMIDVYDADGTGKNRNSFGRVFYTEGKSLVFYAYDLDEKKVVNAKYSFEVWGERLGQPTSVKSLGLLYSDDRAQKRWVLKVSDPEQLSEIDSVFVTLEPQDHGEKPKGKKLLYAFLGGKANHP
jgi:uncharacterized membrane-anchored protein YhcB (DUF1043 family)